MATREILAEGQNVEVRGEVSTEFEGLYGTILEVATDARGRTKYIIQHTLSGPRGWVYTADWVRAA